MNTITHYCFLCCCLKIFTESREVIWETETVCIPERCLQNSRFPQATISQLLEFYKKSLCPIACTPVLFFIKIILTFVGLSSPFASWCIITPHILQCSMRHLNFLISGSVHVVPSLFFPLLLCLVSPTHSLGLSREFTLCPHFLYLALASAFCLPVP